MKNIDLLVVVYSLFISYIFIFWTLWFFKWKSDFFDFTVAVVLFGFSLFPASGFVMLATMIKVFGDEGIW